MTPDDDQKGPWGTRGSQGNGQGPWGQKPQGGGPRSDDNPDLDAVLRQAQDRFKGSFGGGRSPLEGMPAGKGFVFVALVAALLWLGTGFYRVQPEENAVVLRFGKWVDTRETPGLGYALPWPIQEVIKVNVALDRRLTVGFSDGPGNRVSAAELDSESMMLTGDENIIDIDFAVLWKISDAKNYLFKIRDPEVTVKKVAESAMREIIGRTPIQKAMTEARGDVEMRTKELMQKMLDEYESGIAVNNVQLQKVDPPAQVVEAFDDVQRARADKERMKNEAETYRNDIVPRARGEAQKLLQDAEAYEAAVTSKAKGEADRFLSVYKAYSESKDVTQRRIYIETMQQIMQNSKKIIVGDKKGAGVLPYLPLDQLKAPAKTAQQ